MHFHHAFVLDSVGYDMTGKAVSMTLVNPWDNLGERFVLTLDEAMKRVSPSPNMHGAARR